MQAILNCSSLSFGGNHGCETSEETGEMTRLYVHKRAICVCALSLMIIACSEAPDPAGETPVELMPGRYEISRSGAGLVKIDEEKAKETMCVRASDADAFPHKLAKLSHLILPTCSTNQFPREGNKVSGDISCMADQKLADGANRFVYAGVVAPDKVKVDVQMKFEAAVKKEAMTKAEAMQLNLAMKAMERMRFTVEATRSGDC